MKICLELIDKVSDEWYATEYLDYQKTEIKFENINNESGLSEIKLNVLEDNIDEYLNKYPIWRKRAIEFIKKNEHRYTSDHNDRKLQAMIIGKLRHDKARKMLFNIIEDKIECWWS